MCAYKYPSVRPLSLSLSVYLSACVSLVLAAVVCRPRPRCGICNACRLISTMCCITATRVTARRGQRLEIHATHSRNVFVCHGRYRSIFRRPAKRGQLAYYRTADITAAETENIGLYMVSQKNHALRRRP